MKVTRYFQSCLLVEDNGVRVLIDPSGQEKDRLADFGKLDAVLYTHEHGDHFDADMAQSFVQDSVAPVYANASTAKQVKASVTTLEDGKEYKVGSMTVKALELPHCLMIDGSTSVQNTGILINSKLFHPGDGKEIDGLSVDFLAMPLSGPDISAHDGYLLAKQVSAKAVIPIHYDYLGGNPNFFAERSGIPTHALDVGESAEL